MNQMNEAHRRKLRAPGVGDFTLVTKRTKKLQTLIDRAYKCDPRVNAWKREQERLREEKEVTVFSSIDL